MLIIEPDAGYIVGNRAYKSLPLKASDVACETDNEQVSTKKYVIITLIRASKGRDMALR